MRIVKIHYQIMVLFAIIIWLILSPYKSFGATINVPTAEYPTIQAGIDAAVNGDTVLVSDGTYTGDGNKNIDFKGKAITVISQNGPSATVIDCEGEGRGIYFHTSEDGNSILSGFTITNGQADFGAGIACFNSSPTITNCIVTENDAQSLTPADGMGGGIYCEASSPIVSNSIISKNSAVQFGAGIASQNGSSPSITDCSIIENRALEKGMGVYSKESSMSLIRCIIQDNYSMSTAGDGGGIYCNNSNIIIDSCVIKGHRVGSGGGIHCSGGSLEISDSTISENEGTGIPNYGGGIHCSGANLNIKGGVISQNSAGGGGGIYCDNGTINISQCIITDNQSTQLGSDGYGGGGGIFCPNSTGSITNCLIANNSATEGGGISTDGAAPNITNCTFSQNSSSEGRLGYSRSSGGIYIRNSSPIITNSIFWANSPGEIYVDGGNPAVTYTTIQSGWPGEGNVFEDPEFLDPVSGDYHLADYSPCIGTGKSAGAPASDIEGNPRPSPAGSSPDIGAYENYRAHPEPQPLDVFAIEAGNLWNYQVTSQTGSSGRAEEVLGVDSAYQNPTYITESRSDNEPAIKGWNEKTPGALKLVKIDNIAFDYVYPLILWYPMQVGDTRFTQTTSTSVSPDPLTPVDITMTVDVLQKEYVNLGFDTIEAFKIRYVMRTWGFGVDESTTFYEWWVPKIGFIKSQDEEEVEILTSFAIRGGAITEDTDTDEDGLKDYQEEIVHKTNRYNPDTDNDGMPDGWEISYRQDPKSNDASGDYDGDGFSNLLEYLKGTDPTDSDDYPSIAIAPFMLLLLF